MLLINMNGSMKGMKSRGCRTSECLCVLQLWVTSSGAAVLKVTRNQTRRFSTQGRDSSFACIPISLLFPWCWTIILVSSQCRSRYVFLKRTFFPPSKKLQFELKVSNGLAHFQRPSPGWTINSRYLKPDRWLEATFTELGLISVTANTYS